jgi:hypothetical protein
MNVIHLELPRHFTFTIKEYLVEARRLLEGDGHAFRQVDLNVEFWRWLLDLATPRHPGGCFDAIAAASTAGEMAAALVKVRAQLRDIALYYGLEIGLGGLRLRKAVLDSSKAMGCLIGNYHGGGLFAGFFQEMDGKHRLLEADVISLGADDQEGVFWALELAVWLKAAGARARVCLARHAHENFALQPHLEDLRRNGFFFSLIDSVVAREEALPLSLRGLVHFLASGERHRLTNLWLKEESGEVVAIPLDEATREKSRAADVAYVIPDAYFSALPVARDRLVYSMAMVRNKCFYKQCAFCVQIAKHLEDAFYAPGRELERAVAACAELARHGVGMVNFADEAMKPRDLKVFCEALLQRGLNLRWVGRMIASVNLDAATLRLMKEAGCAEILFGMETFEQKTAAAMGKVTGRGAGVEGGVEVVERLLEADIFVILSLIYAFPTASENALAHDVEVADGYLARTSKVVFIFNRFALFHQSAVFHSPSAFGIVPEAKSAENDLQYRFAYESSGPTPREDDARLGRMRVGLGEKAYGALLAAWGPEVLAMVGQVDYSSIGLWWRATRNRSLMNELAGERVGEKPPSKQLTSHGGPKGMVFAPGTEGEAED